MNHNLFISNSASTEVHLIAQFKKKSHHFFALSFLLILISNFAIGQTKVGVRAGLNLSNVSIKDENGNKANTQSSTGFNVGLTVDIPFATNFYVQPGFLYSRKGYKQETGGFYGSAKDFDVKADYLEVPVNVIYKPQLGSGHVLLGAGPYIAYGTGGRWKSGTNAAIGDIVVGNKGDVIFRNDASEGGSIESFTYGRPLDYGLNLLAGYEFLKQFSVQLNAQFGLANLVPDFGDYKNSGKLKNSVYGISVGYKF